MGPPCPGLGGRRGGDREDGADNQFSVGRQTGERVQGLRIEKSRKCLGRYLRVRVGNVNLGVIGL